MKDYILQTIANILDDIEQLVDISEFQKNLAIPFDKKGNLWDYKNYMVPSCKKNLTVNETKVNPDKKHDKKDDASALKSVRTEFSKERKTVAVDNKFKEKLNLIAVKLADDVSLKDKEVYLHTDIKVACSEEKARVCWECAGINCYIKQQLCIKHKIKRNLLVSAREKRQPLVTYQNMV